MKYELHDSQINDILIDGNKIVLSFSEGFWELDTNGKESSQKQNSKIIFNIDNEFSVPIEDFISIRISKRKNVFKPLSLRDFKKLIKKSPFDVYMEYNCVFSSRKFLQLYSNKIIKLFSTNFVVPFFFNFNRVFQISIISFFSLRNTCSLCETEVEL